MEKKSEQSYIKGALVLVSATVIVKVIGMLFKIPLTNILGGVGMTYFSAAYDMFTTLYALSVAGFPVAVSKLVAENMALGRYKDVRKIYRLSSLLFFAVGIIGAFVMIVFARAFSNMVSIPEAYLAVMAMAPAIFFSCIMSSYRGYYQGLNNMAPTAVSQVIEAIVKLIMGIILSYAVYQIGINQFETTGLLFGKAVQSLDEAKIEVLPYAAAGAILGVSISTFAGALYLYLRNKLRPHRFRKSQYLAAPNALGSKKIIKRIISIAVPVCLATVVVNITTLIDLTSVMNRLNVAISRDAQTIVNMYQGLIPDGVGIDKLPQHLYGSYTGLCSSIVNLIPSITTPLGVSILPAIAAAWAVKDYKKIKRSIESLLRIAGMITIPAGIGLCVLSEPILSILYPARPLEVQIAAPLLSIMGIAVLFIGFTSPINSVLQALGKVNVPVKLMLGGSIIKIVVNFILVAIPSINIKGAPVGSLLCYLFIFVFDLIVLSRVSGIKLRLFRLFGKITFSAILCAVAAYVSYSFIYRFWQSKVVILLAIGCGGVVYLVSILLTKALKKEDIVMLPKGEKIAKVLEKYSLLG